MRRARGKPKRDQGWNDCSHLHDVRRRGGKPQAEEYGNQHRQQQGHKEISMSQVDESTAQSVPDPRDVHGAHDDACRGTGNHNDEHTPGSLFQGGKHGRKAQPGGATNLSA